MRNYLCILSAEFDETMITWSLDDLVRFQHLAHLGIRETKISADGVARLRQALPKTVVFK